MEIKEMEKMASVNGRAGSLCPKKRLNKKSIHAPVVLNEPIDYKKSFSRGIRFEIGDMTVVLISGTASIDEKGRTFRPGDFNAQVKRTYRNITELLKAEGADWHDVVKTRCYLKDMKYYKAFNRYRNSLYKKLGLKPFPSSVGVQAELCRPDLLVEIEATAVYRNGSRRSNA